MNRNRPRPLQFVSRESRPGERHASWLELFFDLVFVVAIAARTILYGGIGLCLIGLSAVQWAARALPKRISVGRLCVAVVCFALIGLGSSFTPVVLMPGLTLLLVGLIRVETQHFESA